MSLFNRIIDKSNLSETKRKIVANLYWAVLGKVVTLLGSLLVGIFVARYLGAEQYGLMNYVISYVALFQVFALFGMDYIEIRELSKGQFDKQVVLGTAFRLKLLLAWLTVLLVVGTALLFESDCFTITLIVMYSFSIVFNSFSVIRNYFTSVVWNEYIVKTEIARTLLGAGIKVVLLGLKAPLWAFLAATMFDTVLLASGYVLAYKTKVGLMSDWRFDWQLGKYLLKQSFPLLLSGAAVMVYNRIDQVMIGNMIDKASVGYFSVATRFVEVALFVPTVMSQTIAPILTRTRERSQEEYERKAQLFMFVRVWGCVLMGGGICLLAYWLVRLTFGTEYMLAVPVLQVMAFKVVGMALSNTAGQMIIIENQQKFAFLRNLLGCIVCVLLNLWLIPQYGIMGSAVVTVITTFFVGCLANGLIPPYWRYLRFQLKTLCIGWMDLFKITQIKTWK